MTLSTEPPVLPDSSLRTVVTEALAVRDRVHGSDVRHEVTRALARGATVRTWAERPQAERASWSAPGVAGVVDHLTVAL